MSSLLTRLLQFSRYPAYVVDLFVVPAMLARMRRNGLTVGRNCSFRGMPLLTLHPQSRIIIGDDAFLVSRSRDTALGVNHPIIMRTVRPNAVINMHPGCRASGVTIISAVSVSVGERTVIGANATIVDTDFHSLEQALRSSADDARLASACPVEIGADVFIGGGAMILKGLIIGAGSVIGAGAVVSRNVPPGAIAAGNPAKVVGWVKHEVISSGGQCRIFQKEEAL
jgi:acetyltransferase-like isoleucine patch superfamily enzyme